MRLCCFATPADGTRLGLVDEGRVYDLSASAVPECASLTTLLQASTTRPIADILAGVERSALPVVEWATLDQAPASGTAHLLPPVDRQEVWAAGVTYAWSREARVREAVSKDIYVRVYEAERPEIFFKSAAEKVVGPHDWVGIRGDSHWNVPEPELVVVLNPAMQIVGYTIGNDVSSRDIEGENPLYLPQAKVFRHACALGPTIVLHDAVDVSDLAIRLRITRDGAEAFGGETRTSMIARKLTDLASYLGRYNDFPNGVLLLTGAGIVPGDEFTLAHDDVVEIEIEQIGTLRNVVRQL
jgi:2-dehydro-3-deoxy-D-arabinonate dehydratase